MEDIQYYHGRFEKDHWREFTVACIVPPFLDFSETVKYTLQTNEIFYGIRVGHTLVHPNDNYCKKIGRDHSFVNIVYTKFKLESIDFFSDCIHYYLNSDNLRLTFESKSNRNRLYLIKADYKGLST